MKSCLITGCNGFVGSHLAEFLIAKGVTVYGTVHRGKETVTSLCSDNGVRGKITILECNMLDKEKVDEIVSHTRPDIVFHLAAQSRVGQSWQDPEGTFAVNIFGTLYLLEAIRKTCIDSVVIVVGTAAVYGGSTDGTPIREDREFQPSSPYAVSKACQDLLAEFYWRVYGMNAIRLRPFNITGPGMSGDACSDFAKGIAEIEKGQRLALGVGDLNSVRDITDISDAVAAMWLIAERGRSGEVYNLCSGQGYRIADLLSTLVCMSTEPVRVVQEEVKKRKLQDRIEIGDNSKLGELGWTPKNPIEKTLSDLLNYHRRY